MSKSLKIKTLAICAILFAGIIYPATLTAQRSDLFFSPDNETLYNNRGNITPSDSNMTLGGFEHEDPTVPVGSGLMILLIVGAGYAVMRSKSFNKTYLSQSSYIVLAFALLLGMTQCKKTIMTPATNSNNKVMITVNVGCDGDRTVFNPNDDPNNGFTWRQGVTEYLYVGGSYHEGLMGVLHGTSTEPDARTISFSGFIDGVMDGEILHFIYLGEGTRRWVYSTRMTCIVDQTGTLNDVTLYHIAIGHARYVRDMVEFNTNLNMAMAIAYFDLSEFGNDEIRIYGEDLYTIAAVDYQNGTIVGKVKGSIKTTSVSGGNYIAMIPSTTDQTTIEFVSDNKKGEITFLRGIQEKKYYSSQGSPLLISTEDYTVGTDGLLDGEFTINSQGKKVLFSQGNLQYKGSADKPYWRFADNQWDRISEQGSTDENIDRDLFGWATSGYHRGIDSVNCRNYPFSTESSGLGYASCGQSYVPDGVTYPGYGPTRINKSHGFDMRFQIEPSSFEGESIDYDWGIHNAIRNGGDMPGKWRTLTKDEWVWLVGPPSSINPGTNCRASSTVNGVANARYTAATVNGVHGIILFPDVYSHPASVAQPANINAKSPSGSGGWDANQYNSADWTLMENAGCVFLPAAGYRDGTDVKNSDALGYYWMGDTEAYQTARCFNFTISSMLPSNTGNAYYKNRNFGCSVRLVRDVN